MIDIDELRRKMAKATPGPYRAHTHHGMARFDGDVEKWVGYAWVGRINQSSGPNGEFDSGWIQFDRRKDGDKAYRERANDDALYIDAALNAMPALLDELEALRAANSGVDGAKHTPPLRHFCAKD